MTLRVRIRPDEIWLWQFDPKEPIPQWVFRSFHRTGSSDRLYTANGFTVRPGEWCMVASPNTPERTVGMLTQAEYAAMQDHFEKVPDEMPEGYDL